MFFYALARRNTPACLALSAKLDSFEFTDSFEYTDSLESKDSFNS